MKVLILSASDGRGGAYAAAFRLLQGLEKINVSAKMLVAENTRGHHSVIPPRSILSRHLFHIRSIMDALPVVLYPHRERILFSTAIVPERVLTKVALINPALINLHWVAGGFLRIETLRKFKKPIVWTLHDMWAFTGGCHYNSGCDRYVNSCGQCLQLGSQKQKDVSHWVWKRKKKAWDLLEITIVTPSRWLAECARKSSLFRNRRIEVIPNGLNTNIYKPVDNKFARNSLGLPQNKKLILFGAINACGDKRKGFQFLEPAMKKLRKDFLSGKPEIVIFGATEPIEPPNLGFKTHYMGQFNDDVNLALLYAAVDVFILPSVQDNLPNTIMESLACGTPVVAFNIGGIPDMISHNGNGYLVRAFDTDDLVNGIKWVIENDERHKELAVNTRKKAVMEYSLENQAKRYLSLYEDVLTQHRSFK